jgi:hypothetical protein
MHLHVYIPKIILRFLAVSVLIIVFAGYSFLRADWTPPCCAPPTGNVDAPINSSDSDQIKNGGLTAEAFSSVGGNIGISNNAPKLLLNDMNGAMWWIHNNNSMDGLTNLYFLNDRDKDGVWNDWPPPLWMKAGADASGVGDKVITRGELNANTVKGSDHIWTPQVNADKYCNSDGSVCATLDEILKKTIGPACHVEYSYVSDICRGSSASCPNGTTEVDSSSVKCYTSGSPNYNDYYVTTYTCAKNVCS